MTAPANRAPARVHTVRERWLALRAGAAALAPLALVAGALLLGLFFRLGAFPLFDVDEGAFGEATREMLARGDYVSTWLNGQPRFDKPILAYWLQAASVAVLGPDEFALRLPSALAACAWVGAVLGFGLRFAGRADGYAAAFIAATTVGVTVIGRGAIADALLNLFLVLALFDLYRVFAAQGGADEEVGVPREAVHARRRAFLWMGFGLLTKGPVAVLVPAGASALAFALHGRLGRWWRHARDPLGWLILVAVALPWYAIETWRHGDAFLSGFFLRHNVERFLAPLQGHSGSPLYYLPALFVLLLPWSGLFLATLPGVRRLRAHPLETFLWCWFLFVLVFFSLAATKLPHYLLYGATPLFLLMARSRRRLHGGILAFGPAVLLLAALAALPWALQRYGPRANDPWVREALTQPDVFAPGWLPSAVALVLVVLLLACRRRTPVWPRLCAAALATSFAIGGLLLPALGGLQQGPVKEAALLARGAGWQVRTWQANFPSFAFYRGAVTPAAATLRPGDVVLLRADAFERLGAQRTAFTVLYRRGGILLVRVPG